MRLEVMKVCSSKQWSDVKTEPLTSGYRVDTHVLKVVGSNPSAVLWMDIFHINLL